MNDLIQQYHNKGYVIMPLEGKRPFIKEWQKLTLEESKNLEYKEGCFIGILTGIKSGITVIDCDNESAKEYLESILPTAKDTLIIKTPKGYHYYFKYNPEMKSSVNLELHIDIRNDGAQVVAPPSSGYYFINNNDPIELPYISLLKDRCRVTIIEGVHQGSRNSSAASVVGELFAKGIEFDKALTLMHAWNQQNNPPLPDKEVETVVNSIYKKEMIQAEESIFIPSQHLSSYKKYLNEKRKFKEPNIITGIPCLDKAMHGLQNEFHVVMAEPNVGKTALMLCMAFANARRGKNILYFSTESGRFNIVNRLLSSNYAIDAFKFRTGGFVKEDVDLLNTKAFIEFSAMPFIICDNGNPTLFDIESTVRKYSPEAVFIDHFQECSFDSDSHYEAQKFAKAIKQITRIYNIPVILASQVNPPNSFFSKKLNKMVKPNLTGNDIRSTKAVHQMSEIMLALNYKKNEILGEEFINISIVKGKDIPKGEHYFKYIGKFLRFIECTKEEYETA